MQVYSKEPKVSFVARNALNVSHDISASSRPVRATIKGSLALTVRAAEF